MTKPEIFSIMPFFIVRDVPTALAFYRDRFGFEIYGSPFTLNNGLTSSNDQLFHSGLPDIPGENVIGDVFGLALY